MANIKMGVTATITILIIVASNVLSSRNDVMLGYDMLDFNSWKAIFDRICHRMKKVHRHPGNVTHLKYTHKKMIPVTDTDSETVLANATSHYTALPTTTITNTTSSTNGIERNLPISQSSRGLSDWEERILARHNEYRSGAHGLSGKNSPSLNLGLPQMKWNDHLAAFERNWITQLAGKDCGLVHSSKEARTNVKGVKNYVGENLHLSSAAPEPESIVDFFYSEIKCYRHGPVPEFDNAEECDACYSSNSIGCSRCSRPGHIGHFTQVMWETTTELGCALIQCDLQATGYENYLVGCAYSIGGNMMFAYPFSEKVARALKISPQPPSCFPSDDVNGFLA